MRCAAGSWLCGAELVTSPLRVVGGARGNPTAPVISLLPTQNRKGWGLRLCKELLGLFLCDFLVVVSGGSLNFFFFFSDYERRILPHVFKSTQNVKSLLVCVSAVGYSEFLLQIQML